MDICPSICNKPRRLESIQSYGCIIIVSKDTFNIMGYSENCNNFFNKDVSNMITLSELLSESVKINLYKLLLSKSEKSYGNFNILIENNEYFCHYYKTDGSIILEIEKRNEILFNNLDNNNYTDFLNIICNTNDILSKKNDILKKISDIIGYDRIILYKFLPDWCGEVIGEITNNDSYYGQTFPESDIPQYVRGIFCRNKIRYIENVNDIGIKVIYKNEYASKKEIIDASMSNIINIQPSHKKYLISMNVESVLTLSILVENKLWGVITCHNRNIKPLSSFIRLQCQKIVEIFSYNISIENQIKKQKIHNHIYNLYQYTKMIENIENKDIISCYKYITQNLCLFLKADYTISNIDNMNISYSNSELPDHYSDTIYYLLNNNINILNKLILTNDVKKNVFSKMNFNDKNFAGLIFMKLDEKNWIAFIKKESCKIINWAGIPSKEKYITTPRTSFSNYQENTVNISEAWNIEIENLEEIKEMLNNIVLKIHNKDENEICLIQNSDMFKKQDMIMSNITHEIRNPLNGMIGILEILKLDDIPDQSSLIEDGISLTKVLKNLIIKF